jgi:hypothetical protein
MGHYVKTFELGKMCLNSLMVRDRDRAYPNDDFRYIERSLIDADVLVWAASFGTQNKSTFMDLIQTRTYDFLRRSFPENLNRSLTGHRKDLPRISFILQFEAKLSSSVIESIVKVQQGRAMSIGATVGFTYLVDHSNFTPVFETVK